MFTTRPAHRRATAMMVALASVVAACGDTADDDDAAATTDSAPAAASAPATEVDAPAESAAEPTTASTDSVAESAPATDAAADSAPADTDGETTIQEDIDVLALPAGPAEFPILGGIELDLPEASRVMQGTGCIIIDQPGYTGGSPFPPGVGVAGVVASGFSVPTPISTIDEWLALYEGQPEPTPNGETLNVLGLELEGYTVDGAYSDGPPPDNRFLNCTANAGSASALAFLPSNQSEVYVAETDDALVVINVGAFTADEFDGVKPMFDQIVSTLRSTET